MAAYHRPTELRDALALLAAHTLRVAAGCTDMFAATQAKSLPGDILDITAIPALRGILQDRDGWRIGAATTWSDLLRADLPAAFDGLKLAAREVGSVQIQNAGTLVGNLCTASPAGDGIPCLMTLDASVELCSAKGTRRVPLAQFITGARQTLLRQDELVTAIHIPETGARGGGNFLKLGARKYLIISIAMVATRLELDAGRIAGAAVSVGACSAVATRLPLLETSLIGVAADEASHIVTPSLIMSDLSPIDDIRANKAYRETAAVELIRRSLEMLAQADIGAAA